jgi:hypothetical protein
LQVAARTTEPIHAQAAVVTQPPGAQRRPVASAVPPSLFLKDSPMDPMSCGYEAPSRECRCGPATTIELAALPTILDSAPPPPNPTSLFPAALPPHRLALSQHARPCSATGNQLRHARRRKRRAPPAGVRCLHWWPRPMPALGLGAFQVASNHIRPRAESPSPKSCQEQMRTRCR